MTEAISDITSLSFFQCEELKNEIAAMTDTDGVITDDQMQQLVEVNTQGLVKLGRLCNFIRLCESKIETCKQKKAEVAAAQNRAENVVGRLKSYLAIWARKQKHNPVVNEYELRTRKSVSVLLDDGFRNPIYGKIVETFQPDKKKIKEDIQAGIEVKGAVLQSKLSLTIKG